jgi:hypothetical protein
MAVIVTAKGHRFDRSIPEPLPAHRMLSRVSLNLPSVVDLRSWCGPIKNQGAEGSCTGNSSASAGEWIFRKYAKFWLPKGAPPNPQFSAQYTYEWELITDGNFPSDAGSDGETACEVAILKGFCPLALDPYVAGQITQPTAAQDAAAGLYRMGAYHGLTGSQVMQSVLGDPVPWPVLVGFTVYDSLESDEVAATGIYNPNVSTESVLGGHEVLAVGYDLGAIPTLRPAACPPAFLIQNSWSDSWGLKGFFWMVTSVIDAADGSTDLKITHAGGKW